MCIFGLFVFYKSNKLWIYFSILLNVIIKMVFGEYSMNFEIKKVIKINEEYCDSGCEYCMKRLNEDGCEVYVWFRICFCGKIELKDRLKEYYFFFDGDSLLLGYLKNGIYVYYVEVCFYWVL